MTAATRQQAATPPSDTTGGTPAGRLLAIGGTAAVAASVVVVGVLDAWTLDWPRSPVTRTISEYALGPLAVPFHIAVLLLAAGSVAVLVALVRAGLTGGRSGGVIAVALWSIGLTMVVLFQKHDWSVGPSPSGYVHQLSSLTAFVSLPIGGVLLTRPWHRDGRWAGRVRPARVMALLSLLWFPLIIAALLIAAFTGVSWWHLVPLGLTERLLTITEVVVVLLLGRWAMAAHPAGARPELTTP